MAEKCVLSENLSLGAIGLTPLLLGGIYQQALNSVPVFSKNTWSQSPYLWTRIVPLHIVRASPVVFRNVIVNITISSRSFVFSQSCCKVSASLTDVGGLAVGTFDLINRSFLLLGSSLSLTLVSKCRNVVIGL